jgi:beta-phosphoglucomutase-like phosphatase (HAD superfamily)
MTNVYGLEKISNLILRSKIMKTFSEKSFPDYFDASEFSLVLNPEGVHPAFDIYPLANRVVGPIGHISAILMDMDGTTTTTEPLCLQALEKVIQTITAFGKNSKVTNLDRQKDYPNIIGNSTTKHLEYLLVKYKKFINLNYLLKFSAKSARWTVANCPDPKRQLSAQALLYLLQNPSFRVHSLANGVKMAVEIYYHFYHQTLASIQGKKPLLPPSPLIQPMPFVGEFLCLVKGLLGNEASFLGNTDSEKHTISLLSKKFTRKPAKIALVTSSIKYEADIVLSVVFQHLKQKILGFKITSSRKKNLLKIFKDPYNFYDAIITADDSHEIRLKPHRDLYSIALCNLAIDRKDFPSVIGLEDSESGILALRAAGIGRALAVPFEQTKNHNLSAATLILTKGLKQLVLEKKLFFLDPGL